MKVSKKTDNYFYVSENRIVAKEGSYRSSHVKTRGYFVILKKILKFS